MGTALLGSLFTSRVAADLPHELAAHGVPAAARAPVEAVVTSGSTGTRPLSSAGRGAWRVNWRADGGTAGA
jgi:DHA2 family multidrug resistance protein-like MFS transporter